MNFSAQITHTSWSLDGTKIVFLQFSKKGIYTISVEGGEVGQIPNNEDWGSVEVAQTSPARDMVIYVDQKGSSYRINEIEISGGDPRNIITFSGGAEHPHAVAESYDGNTIAYTTPQWMAWSHNLFFVSVSGGNPIAITDFYGNQPRNPTWSPLGDQLVIQLPSGLYMVDLKLK
jgi:Tol biopolymer transport system component